MNPRTHPWRRRAAAAARTGFVVSSLGFVSALTSVVTGPAAPAAAAAADATMVAVDDGGVLGAPLTGGGSEDDFGLLLPTGAACPGDSANDGYRLSGYMVASSVDPATLTFDVNGPTGNQYGNPQATFRQPLYGADFSSYTAGQTSNAPASGEPGPISSLPPFAFSSFTDLAGGFGIPPGSYNLGIGCYVPVVGGAPMEDFWNVVITVVTDTADPGPADIAWTVVAPPTTTSVVLSADPAGSAALGESVELTATIDPAGAPGTITFRDEGVDLGAPVTLASGAASMTTDALSDGDHVLSATFTPADGSAFAPSTSSEVPFSVTQAGASTTSTTTRGATSTTLAGGVTSTTSSVGGAGVSTGSPLGSLARTGSSLSMVVWGGLMLIFGRMAILLGRGPSVRPARV